MSYGVATSFFTHPDDKNCAILCVNALRKSPSHPGPSLSHTQTSIVTHYHNYDKLRKLAYNISQRFKNTEDLFSGNIGEDIEEYFKTYETASIDYKLTPSLQLKYFHNLFEVEATRHYRDKVAEVDTE